MMRMILCVVLQKVDYKISSFPGIWVKSVAGNNNRLKNPNEREVFLDQQRRPRTCVSFIAWYSPDMQT